MVFWANISVSDRRACNHCEVERWDVLKEDPLVKCFSIFLVNKSISCLPIIFPVVKIKKAEAKEKASAKVHDKYQKAHLHKNVTRGCDDRCFAEEFWYYLFQASDAYNFYEEHHGVEARNVVPVEVNQILDAVRSLTILSTYSLGIGRSVDKRPGFV